VQLEHVHCEFSSVVEAVEPGGVMRGICKCTPVDVEGSKVSSEEASGVG